MKLIKPALAFFLLATGSTKVQAADIEVLGGQLILSGDITKGDANKFRTASMNLPAGTIIRLQSPGGLTSEGIEIGKTIRQRAFYTYASYRDCASACGLIWLAGVKRWINPNAGVGFHQTYSFKDGNKQSSAMGNALVGGYIARLGYSDQVIAFATLKGPDDLIWIDAQIGRQLGIPYQVGLPGQSNPPTISNNSNLARRSSGPNRPSFDCGIARSKIEQTICSSTEISDLDRRMAELYFSKRKYRGVNKRSLLNRQRAWMRKRKACRSDISCLRRLYLNHIAFLERL